MQAALPCSHAPLGPAKRHAVLPGPAAAHPAESRERGRPPTPLPPRPPAPGPAGRPRRAASGGGSRDGARGGGGQWRPGAAAAVLTPSAGADPALPASALGRALRGHPGMPPGCGPHGQSHCFLDLDSDPLWGGDGGGHCNSLLGLKLCNPFFLHFSGQ